MQPTPQPTPTLVHSYRYYQVYIERIKLLFSVFIVHFVNPPSLILPPAGDTARAFYFFKRFKICFGILLISGEMLKANTAIPYKLLMTTALIRILMSGLEVIGRK